MPQHRVPRVRIAVEHDAAAIAALSIEVWIGTYLRHGISSTFADYVLDTFTPQKTAAFLSDPSQRVWVSENAEGIDGFIRLAAASEAPVADCPDSEIVTFYVQPRHHGTGIGTALLNTALAFARRQEAAGVWLSTNAQNTPAIEFYRRKGFTHIGHTHFALRDQAYLNNVYLYAF